MLTCQWRRRWGGSNPPLPPAGLRFKGLPTNIADEAKTKKNKKSCEYQFIDSIEKAVSAKPGRDRYSSD